MTAGTSRILGDFEHMDEEIEKFEKIIDDLMDIIQKRDEKIAKLREINSELQDMVDELKMQIEELQNSD